MDRIPRELAERFAAAGGTVRLSSDLQQLTIDEGLVRLRFADGAAATARHVVLAMPISALQALATDAAVIDTPAHRRIFNSVEGFPATKLYPVVRSTVVARWCLRRRWHPDDD